MRVQINEVFAEGSTTLVSFTCEAGEAVALWRDATPPRPCHEYDAELNLVLVLDDIAVTGPAGRHRLEIVGDDVLLHGAIEAVEEDGVVFVRLAPSLLMMIESSRRRAVGEQLTLRAPFRKLEMFVHGS